MKKSTYILGLNEAQSASAALMRDDKIIAAAQEERFTGIKNQHGFPKNAIAFCCDFAKIKSSDIDLVVLSYIDPYPHFTNNQAIERPKFIPKYLQILRNIAPTLEYKIPFLNPLTEFGRSLYYFLYQPKNQIVQIKEISKILKIPTNKIFRINHHLCHAYGAFYSNPKRLNPTLAITCDGAGDQLCSSIYKIQDNNFTLVSQTSHIHSLGLFYAAVTGYLGFKPHEDEYKIMGLAPYARGNKNINQIINIFKNLIQVHNLQFESKIPARQYGLYLHEKLSNFRFDHIANATQSFFEKILTDWVSKIINTTKIYNLVFSGGVFLNVKANQKITNLRSVKNIFFMPSPGDDTNAFGACYYGARLLNTLPLPLENLYLGPKYSTSTIRRVIISSNLKYEKPKNLSKKIAYLLNKNEIVAVFADRMEFGSRALGNRSILANPSNPNSVEKINKMIKLRDFWMPFAATIFSEKASEYIINPKKLIAPFMILAFDTKNKAQKDLKAAIHPYDKSIRPQILNKNDNPKFYQIIKEFEKLTGISGVLNTSFNLHGEPVVCTPQDAISTFKRSDLKYLVLQDYLIYKK